MYNNVPKTTLVFFFKLRMVSSAWTDGGYYTEREETTILKCCDVIHEPGRIPAMQRNMKRTAV